MSTRHDWAVDVARRALEEAERYLVLITACQNQAGECYE